MEKKINEIYNEYMTILKPHIGSGITYTDDLEKKGKHIWGDRFLGVFPSDKIPKFKKNNTMFIANLDNSNQPGSHWVGVYLKNGNSHVYDSFGRKSKKIFPSIYGKGHKVIDAQYDAEQPKTSDDCGLRTIVALYMYDTLDTDLVSKYL